MYNLYNEDYYHSGCGPIPYEEPEHWIKFFGHVADKIIATINPTTVLDAGCAMGYLVAALRDRGVEAYGVDISEYAISMVRKDIKPYCFISSLTESLPQGIPNRFDLVVTIEVLEHLCAEDGKKVIENLCNYSDTIIFSSTPDDFTEPTHINVQQREYWSMLFAKNGFYNDLNTRPDYITSYAVCYRNNKNILEQIESYERNIRLVQAEQKKQLEQIKKQTFYTTLYWATSEYGFGEENKITYNGDLCDGLIHFQVNLSKDITALRFDPMEIPCVVEDLHIYSDKGTLQVIPENGIEYKEKYVFLENDPRFQIILDGKKVTTIDLRARVTPLSFPEQKELLSLLFDSEKQLKQKQLQLLQEMEQNKIAYKEEIAQNKAAYEEEIAQNKAAYEEEIAQNKAVYEEEISQNNAIYKEKLMKSNINYEQKKQECKKIQETLDDYIKHYNEAVYHRDDLQQQLIIAQHSYNVISNAFFWKITKPARVLTDILKKPFRGNRHAQLMRKGILCLRQNGLSYTWQKLKGYKKKQTPYKTEQIIYTDQELKTQELSEEEQIIKFSIIVPLYNTPQHFLKEMIDSVLGQTYKNWELCLADGSDNEHSYIQSICMKYCKNDTRILYKHLEKNAGISENTNACASMANGDYIALLDHDDVLMPNALYANFEAICETDADVLYSDEDHLSVDGKHISPFFKPDWSPDLLYGQMYICHFLVFKRSLFLEIGGFRSKFDGSQDYDLMLRMSEKTDRICHIPRILYSWRESDNSTALNADSKPYSHTAGKAALDEHLKRKYGSYAHAEDSGYMFVYEARFDLPKQPLVSIIIPMKDKWEMTADCIKSIIEKSTYQNYEIIILDNRSEQYETKKWFDAVTNDYQNVSVISADMEFNWSKLNNFGMKNANGEVYVFLNNDTLLISPDWLERLVENACREDIGVVGALLLYPDNTIQHSGVVVGMGGWADHIFKGMKPVHCVGPYVSPVISRNVLAVTGACMAVSKHTIDKIGGFDEEFVICGSDVELCIRAHDYGLFNRIDANVRLYHLESKSRDNYIPEIDFDMSYRVYTPYRENIDPYFNINLDRNSVIPKECIAPVNLVNFKNFLKRCPVTKKAYETLKQSITAQDYKIPEIEPMKARKSNQKGLRLNLLIPSVDQKHVFGGIATALDFFEKLCEQLKCNARIIAMDAAVEPKSIVGLSDYEIISCEEDSDKKYQIIPMADRSGCTIPVSSHDIFVATGWWTAYVISDVYKWQSKTYHAENPLIYIIQDYEPGFYPWSSRYVLADSTYCLDIPTYAVFNSELLKNHFDLNGYKFEKSWTFSPILNNKIKKFLPEDGTIIDKKKQILIYGRPSVERNAFSLIVYALNSWSEQFAGANEWEILSAGEKHEDIKLSNGCVIHSVGKLTLDEYSKMLMSSYVGISLMVSPHPSYPPLEMSTFGIKTITNCYGNKDLSNFSKNIYNLSDCSPDKISKTLADLCSDYSGKGVICVNKLYTEDISYFDKIANEIKESLI